MCDFCKGKKKVPLIKQHPETQDATLGYTGYQVVSVETKKRKVALFDFAYCPFCGEKLKNKTLSG